MRVDRGRLLWARWVVLVQVVGLALLLSACDMGGPLPVATPTLPGSTPDEGINLPDDILTPMPGTDSLTPTALPAIVSDEDRDAIYGLAVRNLIKNEQAQSIYISPFVGEGEQLDQSDDQLPLSETLDDNLQLLDPEREYRLAEFSEVVGALEDGGTIVDGGVFITLGQLVEDPESAGAEIVAVRGSIYRGRGDAAGNLYRFQRDDTAPDGWRLLEVVEEWSEEG